MALPRNVRRRKPSHSQANVCSSPNTCNCPIPPVGVCMQGTIQGAGSWEMNYCATDNGWNIGFNGMDWLTQDQRAAIAALVDRQLVGALSPML